MKAAKANNKLFSSNLNNLNENYLKIFYKTFHINKKSKNICTMHNITLLYIYRELSF